MKNKTLTGTKGKSRLNIFNMLNENKGNIVYLNIASIVKGNPLSSFILYSRIKNAIVTHFPGEYETESGFHGTFIHERSNGILIHLKGDTQLFIDESAKMEIRVNDEKVSVINIRDTRSSMYIQMQIFKGTGGLNNGN